MISLKNGHIVNIASLAGHAGQKKLVDYCSSKFAAVGLDEALKIELKVLGHDKYINSTVVCPYFISTGMFDGVQSKVIFSWNWFITVIHIKISNFCEIQE